MNRNQNLLPSSNSKFELASYLASCFLIACAATGAQARTVSGLVYPLHDITLSAGVAGLVMQRMVEPGQRVSSNQTLLLLDDRIQVIESERRKVIFEDQSELLSAQQRTEILGTLLEDAKSIFKATGSVSKDELLRLDAEYVSSKGRVDQLKSQKKRERLDYETAERERLQRQITAPVGGIVTKMIPQVGEWAKPGDPIAMLVDPATAVLHVAIPYLDINALKLGQVQSIVLEAGGSTTQATGKVTFISPVADAASGLVEVRITFSNSQLGFKPGIKGSIQVPSQSNAR